jgi:tetratricopeptide (TPR) repeat protein
VVHRRWGSGLAWIGLGCATLPAHPIARELHDRGVAYLELAMSSPADFERERLCDRAEESCRLALEYDDRFAHGYNCLGMIELWCRRDPGAAAERFKDALSRSEDFAEVHNNLGVAFSRQTPPDHDAACEEYEAAIEIDPGYADARENLGVCEIHRGRLERARSHLMRLVEIVPAHAGAHHHLGLIALQRGRYEESEHHFLRCLAIDPDRAECSYNLGNLYLETSRYDDAILAFIAAARHERSSPVSIAARQNLRIAYERAAQHDGAIRRLIDRARQNPGDARLRYDLGAIFAERGLFAEAVREWMAAIAIAPDYCPAHHRLALEAHRALDAEEASRRCRATLDCAARRQDERDRDAVAECREILDGLEEPSRFFGGL